jgi:hypothetical protein
MSMSEPICCDCYKKASELYDPEFLKDEGMSATQYARQDGTFNSEFNTVCCDECYINRGCPSSPRGWKAGPPNDWAHYKKGDTV